MIDGAQLIYGKRKKESKKKDGETFFSWDNVFWTYRRMGVGMVRHIFWCYVAMIPRIPLFAGDKWASGHREQGSN